MPASAAAPPIPADAAAVAATSVDPADSVASVDSEDRGLSAAVVVAADSEAGAWFSAELAAVPTPLVFGPVAGWPFASGATAPEWEGPERGATVLAVPLSEGSAVPEAAIGSRTFSCRVDAVAAWFTAGAGLESAACLVSASVLAASASPEPAGACVPPVGWLC